MSVRLLLTEEAWAELAPLLAMIKSRAGRPPALRDRLCIEAVRAPGHAVACPPSRCWPLGRGVQSLAPLGTTWQLAPAPRSPPAGGLPHHAFEGGAFS
jgi:hypothetical protein